MHGIIGQLAHDPAQLAIVVVTAIAIIAILRRLSDLAFVDSQQPTESTPETQQ